MDAIVCDRCGNVLLLEDGFRPRLPKDFARMSGVIGGNEIHLDLCADCARDLVGSTRGRMEDDGK